MKRLMIALALALVAGDALADIVVPTRTIRAKEPLSLQDFEVRPGELRGVVNTLAFLEGMEARVALYPGRPIRLQDVGPPALVDRNEIVVLVFATGGLQIRADGRALSEGALGDRVRVMNLASRSTLFGTVAEDGTVHVGGF
jgi:flagella basal body P-ring formation protein FlgA